MAQRVFMGLGSNLGDRLAYILKALDLLSRNLKVVRVSTVYESDPWGVENQPPFLNCVVEARTELTPPELLRRLKEVEQALGRKRRFRWGPREIDVDILLFGNVVLESPDLRIPHPHLVERDFFLLPLLELDPLLRDPSSGVPYASFGKRSFKLRPFCCVIWELPSS